MISGPASTLTPVRLPPGRAKLAIRPLATGSLVIPTIGIVAVTLSANALYVGQVVTWAAAKLPH